MFLLLLRVEGGEKKSGTKVKKQTQFVFSVSKRRNIEVSEPRKSPSTHFIGRL